MSTVVQWSERLAMGIPEIDAQHRGLIETINDLWYAIVANSGARGVARILDQLDRYVVEHFGAEEALMREEAYPGLDAHLAQHAHFRDHIVSARRSLDSGIVPSLDLLNYLTDWLATHIQTVDRAYATYLEERQRPHSIFSRFFSSPAGHRR